LQQQDIEFQLLPESSSEPPVFTLTCVTTGGPPTAVNWTRDGTAIDYQSNSSFRFSRTVTDLVTATYNNTLTVTGNFPGLYSISAQNQNTALYALSTAATSTLQVEGKYLYTSVHKYIFVVHHLTPWEWSSAAGGVSCCKHIPFPIDSNLVNCGIYLYIVQNI